MTSASIAGQLRVAAGFDQEEHAPIVERLSSLDDAKTRSEPRNNRHLWT